jgi:hypothetical protein
MTGELDDRESSQFARISSFNPITNISGVSRRVKLGELIDEHCEFAFRTHQTVKISPSAHWFRRVPRFRAAARMQGTAVLRV